jgi:hypothetical protein
MYNNALAHCRKINCGFITGLGGGFYGYNFCSGGGFDSIYCTLIVGALLVMRYTLVTVQFV